MPIDHEFKFRVLQGIRDIGDDFEEPDDDWNPVFLTPDSIMPLIFDNEMMKDIFANVIIPMAIKETKAKEYAFVSSVWVGEGVDQSLTEGMTTEEAMEYIAENYPPPSLQLNRKEAVMAHFGASDGTLEIWSAKITRHESAPPTLGEWELMKTPDKLAGRFIDPLMEAVKKNA